MAQMMKAAVFVAPGRIALTDKPIPDVGLNDALIKITTTSCGTDVHILKGEYPVEKGLTVGHEPVGVIVKLGSAVTGDQEGQRVIAGARLKGATTIIAVDGNDHRLGISRTLGADVTLNFNQVDVVEEVLKLTGGKGADSAIEALGTQQTFESAMRCIRPGGTLSSLGVYSIDLKIQLGPFGAGLGDHRINTALCPGGKERMRRLMNVIASQRLDLGVLVTHERRLDDIVEAYDLFANQRDGVLKIAIKP